MIWDLSVAMGHSWFEIGKTVRWGLVGVQLAAIVSTPLTANWHSLRQERQWGLHVAPRFALDVSTCRPHCLS